MFFKVLLLQEALKYFLHDAAIMDNMCSSTEEKGEKGKPRAGKVGRRKGERGGGGAGVVGHTVL